MGNEVNCWIGYTRHIGIYYKNENMKATLLLLKITTISWFLFWILIFYLKFVPLTVFELTKPLFVPSPVKSGETVTYIEDYCKYIGNKGTVVHALQKKLTDKEKAQGIADISYVFDPLKDVNVPTGCHSFSVNIVAPESLEKGREYRVFKTIHIRVNIVRTVDLEFYSNWFKVI